MKRRPNKLSRILNNSKLSLDEYRIKVEDAMNKKHSVSEAKDDEVIPETKVEN